MEDILYNDYDDSYYDDFEEDYPNINTMPTPTLSETFENCVLPSMVQITNYIGIIIGWNLLFRLGWTMCMYLRFPQDAVHAVSLICGCGLLHYTVGNASKFLVSFSLFAYVIMTTLMPLVNVKRIGWVMAALCLTVLMVCELLHVDPVVWHKIRGMQMVISMKVISLAFDWYTLKPDVRNLNLLKYLGYLLCPASVSVGPWVSYREYLSTFNELDCSLRWIFWTLLNIIFSVFFVVTSNCFAPLMFPDNSWKWLVAFRDALSFRYSHYFVSYLSQATMSASGAVRGFPEEELNKYFGFVVTKMTAIEFPRSLGKVVVCWNIPMHRWLKTYVFKVVKVHNTMLAIFATYLVSSLLHGLHFQIYAVLLSLGIYTFVEYKLRYKLSQILNSCTLIAKCRKQCTHHYKSDTMLALGVNLLFSGVAIFHLAYLGVMFDTTSTQDTGHSLAHVITKWNNLDFLSHWVVFGTYLFNVLI